MRALVNDFMAQNIRMPDDVLERVLLTRQSEDIYPSNATSHQAYTAHSTPTTPHSKHIISSRIDDVSSDADEIRAQAESSQDPELGSNII